MVCDQLIMMPNQVHVHVLYMVHVYANLISVSLGVETEIKMESAILFVCIVNIDSYCINIDKLKVSVLVCYCNVQRLCLYMDAIKHLFNSNE